MAAIIYVSVGHSYNMLVFAGMSGTAALVFVGVWETVFIYCSILIDLDHYRGEKSGQAPWIGFLMGFAFVVVSNYMGMANNLIGKTIGISTPILLLVMKRVLAYQFRKEEKKSNRLWEWIKSKFEKKEETVDAAPDAKTDANPDAETVVTDTKAGAEADAFAGVESDAKADTELGAKADARPDTEAGGNADAITGADEDAKVDTKADATAGVKVDTEPGAKADTETYAQTDTQADVKVDAAKDQKADTKASAKAKTAKPKKSTDREFARVKRWAKKYQSENGKLPGRVEIQKKFSTFSKSMCAKYAAMLKEEAS
ncbi:hypothetical protein [Staphylospora marina]|uniref:hypothetical protein n=1 Tax=Staphylospora marina TaxID=2490858 RepID=UPI000F5B9EF9|nr:hypothetical protein [Staphylospora marina]